MRQRGSLTVRFTEAAIAAWKAEPRGTRGGQPRCSDDSSVVNGAELFVDGGFAQI